METLANREDLDEMPQNVYAGNNDFSSYAVLRAKIETIITQWTL